MNDDKRLYPSLSGAFSGINSDDKQIRGEFTNSTERQRETHPSNSAHERNSRLLDKEAERRSKEHAVENGHSDIARTTKEGRRTDHLGSGTEPAGNESWAAWVRRIISDGTHYVAQKGSESIGAISSIGETVTDAGSAVLGTVTGPRGIISGAISDALAAGRNSVIGDMPALVEESRRYVMIATGVTLLVGGVALWNVFGKSKK